MIAAAFLIVCALVALVICRLWMRLAQARARIQELEELLVSGEELAALLVWWDRQYGRPTEIRVKGVAFSSNTGLIPLIRQAKRFFEFQRQLESQEPAVKIVSK